MTTIQAHPYPQHHLQQQREQEVMSMSKEENVDSLLNELLSSENLISSTKSEYHRSPYSALETNTYVGTNQHFENKKDPEEKHNEFHPKGASETKMKKASFSPVLKASHDYVDKSSTDGAAKTTTPCRSSKTVTSSKKHTSNAIRVSPISTKSSTSKKMNTKNQENKSIRTRCDSPKKCTERTTSPRHGRVSGYTPTIPHGPCLRLQEKYGIKYSAPPPKLKSVKAEQKNEKHLFQPTVPHGPKFQLESKYGAKLPPTMTHPTEDNTKSSVPESSGQSRSTKIPRGPHFQLDAKYGDKLPPTTTVTTVQTKSLPRKSLSDSRPTTPRGPNLSLMTKYGNKLPPTTTNLESVNEHTHGSRSPIGRHHRLFTPTIPHGPNLILTSKYGSKLPPTETTGKPSSTSNHKNHRNRNASAAFSATVPQSPKLSLLSKYGMKSTPTCCASPFRSSRTVSSPTRPSHSKTASFSSASSVASTASYTTRATTTATTVVTSITTPSRSTTMKASHNRIWTPTVPTSPSLSLMAKYGSKMPPH